MKKQNQVVFKDLQKYTLLVVLLILLSIFLYFISPFFGVLIISGVIAIDVFPMNKWLTKKVRYKQVASLITLLLIILVVLTPFALFVTYITGEATDAYLAFRDSTDISSLTNDIGLLPEKLRDTSFGAWITNNVPVSSEDLLVWVTRTIEDSLDAFSSILVAQTGNVVKQLSLFSLYVITFLLALYYFLTDGDKFATRLKHLLPIPSRYKNELFSRLNMLSKGIVYGVFGAAIVQGLLAGLGFFIAGIDNAAFWGTIMALFSPVPYIGTAIIWVPAAIYLMLSGSTVAGVFLFIWGAVIVATADNFVKPYLIGKSAEINSLAVLLTILGGVLTLGLEGLVFGPFLLMLLLSFLHIYELEYKKVLEE